MEWSGVDYLWIIVMFLSAVSFWRHPFTAEDPLVRKWCNATFLQIWWRNKLICILDGLRMSTFSAHFYFWENYSFKCPNDFVAAVHDHIHHTRLVCSEWPLFPSSVLVFVWECVDLLCVNSSTETDLDLQECVLVLFWDSVLSGVCRSV